MLKIYAAAKRAPNGGRPNGFARKASDAIATVASWAIASYCNVALAVSYAVLIAFAIVVTHGAARRLDAPKPDWGKSPARQVAPRARDSTGDSVIGTRWTPKGEEAEIAIANVRSDGERQPRRVRVGARRVWFSRRPLVVTGFGVFEVQQLGREKVLQLASRRVVHGVAESRAPSRMPSLSAHVGAREARASGVRFARTPRGGARRRRRDEYRDVRRARSSPRGGPRGRRASRERAPSRERGRVDGHRHPRDVAQGAPRVAPHPREGVPPTRRDARPSTPPRASRRRRRAQRVGGPRAPRPDARRRAARRRRARKRHRGAVFSPRRGRPLRRTQVRADADAARGPRAQRPRVRASIQHHDRDETPHAPFPSGPRREYLRSIGLEPETRADGSWIGDDPNAIDPMDAPRAPFQRPRSSTRRRVREYISYPSEGGFSRRRLSSREFRVAISYT